MSQATSVRELLLRWAEARRLGQALTPEELCRDCPERLDELRREIRLCEASGTLPDGDRPEAAGAAPEPPPTAGRYRAVRPPARGGLGEVFVGEDGELNRPVALKRIRDCYAYEPAHRRRFLREAEITARLQHPGIVPVYGLTWDEQGRPCYAMRFIEGESLQDALQRFHEGAGPSHRGGFAGVEFRQLLQRFVAVCNAVAYAHSRGIVHRDLKPANVMLGRYAETLVVDWGLARPVERTEAERASGEESLAPANDLGPEQTAAGHALGTPAYMSPEQAAGAWDELGPPADIFSLGATLYAILTGQPPYAGSAYVALGRAKRRDLAPPRRLKPGLPPALEAVCLRAMAREPRDRYPTALELAAEVERWLADEPVTAYPEPLPDRARRWVKRHRPLVTGAAAALLVGLVSLAVAATLLAGANVTIRTERDRALAARSRTRAALDAMTSIATGEAMAIQRALSKEQRTFLEGVLGYYEEFAAEPGEDRESRQRLAEAHHRLAMIHLRLGQSEKAVPLFRRAAELSEQLAAEYPGAPEYRQQQALSLCNLATIVGQLGRGPESEAAFQRAIELQENLAAEHPGVLSAHKELARSHNNLGAQLAGRGCWAEAEAAFRRAIAVRKRVADEFPDLPEHHQALAMSHGNLGLLLDELGKQPEAEAEYTTAIELYERLVGQSPEPAYRRELAMFHNNLGALLRTLHRLPAAERAQRRALELRERLAAEFLGVPEYREELAESFNNLGLLLDDLGKRPEAIGLFRRAVEQFERLAAEYRGLPAYRHGLATSLSNLATHLEDVPAKRAEAEAALRRAIELEEALARETSDVLRSATSLGGGYGNMGNLLWKMGKSRDALGWYAKAVARLQPLVAAKPPLAKAVGYLRNAHAGRARALVHLGRYAESVPDWERAIELDDGRERETFRYARATCLLLAGQAARSAAAAEELAATPGTSAGTIYQCASILASAAARSPRDADRLAGRAVALLRQAFTAGYRDVAQVFKDAAFNGFRTRTDYVDLLWDLADLPAARP